MLVVIQREGAVVMSKNVAELERRTAFLVPGKGSHHLLSERGILMEEQFH